MKKYEAMFIVRPDLPEEERKILFGQINEIITKNGGKVSSAAVWSEKRKMCFKIKKYAEGVYYLVNFTCIPTSIDAINRVYKMNENILRVLISSME